MADLILKFDGDLAERHVVPASDAGNTLVGVGVALNRVAYFLEHDRARYRGPYSENVRILVSHPKPGSLEFPFLLEVANNPIALAIGVELTGASVLALAKFAFRRATGQEREGDLAPWDKIPPGTLDAVAESVEKPLKQAHYVIGSGAENVNIFFGHEDPVQFDQKTKEFLGQSNYINEVKSELGRVSALNGNDNGGRIFIPSIGKGVSFTLDDEIDDASVGVILWSQSQYFRGRASDIVVSFTRWETPSEQTKHLIIRRAERVEE